MHRQQEELLPQEESVTRIFAVFTPSALGEGLIQVADV